MTEKGKIKKRLSLGTHNRLGILLHVCYNVNSIREQNDAYEKLRNYLATIFSYEEILEYHNEHLVELAEIVQGLYPEKDDLANYTYHILEYLNKRLATYTKIRDNYIMELSKCRRADTKSDEYLNLKYRAWTYSHGYYAGQAQMYRLLRTYLSRVSELEHLAKATPTRKRKGGRK